MSRAVSVAASRRPLHARTPTEEFFTPETSHKSDTYFLFTVFSNELFCFI